MRRQKTHSTAFSLMVLLLVEAQLVFALPPPPTPAPVPRPQETVDPLAGMQVERREPVKPRIKPRHTAIAVNAPTVPRFSPKPTEQEIFNARVFSEPVVPIGGESTAEERRALANALLDFVYMGGGEKLGPILTFIKTRPDSVYRAALWYNVGLVYRKTGYFSRALNAWEKAWALSKHDESRNGKVYGDAAVGQLSELSARLGRMERLESLFEEIAGRNIRGSATEQVSGAKWGLSMMKHRPEETFRCGPYALDRILAYDDMRYVRPEAIETSRSTVRGISLPDVQALSRELGLDYQMAKRESSEAELVVPAVVHWRSEHYAALLEERDGRYLIEDLTFADQLWVSRAALEDESSGYFLVGEGPLPSGWRPVDSAEGQLVWGKGQTDGQNAENTKCTDPKAGGGCSTGFCRRNGGFGLAAYSFHAMVVSLNITDVPVGYSPPVGPRVDFQLTYNQRDAFQPPMFTYSNFGPKWTFDYLTYVEDDPINEDATVYVYARGGGRETFEDTGINAEGHRTYETHIETHAELVQIQHDPPEYERRLPDGSVEVFKRTDGAAVAPRKTFLTEWRDPQGNSVTLEYDTNPSFLRVTKLIDAIGQATDIYYEHADPYKITKVEDPFGRAATFTYNADGQLESITDVIGLVSSFEYGLNDFITALITPYGRTTFAMGEFDTNGRNRWLEATDPLGGRERLEYWNQNNFVPGSEDDYEVPWDPDGFVGMGEDPAEVAFVGNDNLEFRNTFYWSKLAMDRAPGDYSQAEIFHWLKEEVGFSPLTTSGTLKSRKMPLENRVWYKYEGQGNHLHRGTSHQPMLVARVVDVDTPSPSRKERTQVYQYEYNSRGQITRETDPLGRETVYEYAANEQDVLRVKQKNGANYDLLQEMTYNSAHLPLTTKDAGAQTTTYTYNAQGQALTVTTPPRAGISENRTTTYDYDEDGYLESVTGSATGATTSYTYESYGRTRTVTDSDGYVLTFDYDALDRQTKVTYPDSTYEETVYERLDAVRSRDRLGRWTHRIYDALRRVLATTDPLGRTVTQQWCGCGSMDALIDANGNVTSWERDLQGRVTKEIRANASEWAYAYETTTSRLKTVTDPKAQVKTYSYLLDDNLEGVGYTNEQYATPDVSFTYETAYNRVSTMVDGTGTTTYGYHPIGASPALGAGRLATVDGPLSNDVISYAYDELGRVASRTINGVALTYEYDALGRIATETNVLGAFSYQYDVVTSRLKTVTYPNGQTSSYAYYGNSGDQRLQEIHHKKSIGTTLSKFNYTYDAAGNILTWTQQQDTSAAKAYDFEYDRADQLRNAVWRTTDQTPTILKRYGYTYDPAGNRTVEQIDNAPGLSAYDNMNRLSSQTPGGTMRFAGTLNEAATVTIAGAAATVTSDDRFAGDAQVGSGTTQVVVKAKDYSGNERTNTYEVSVSGSSKSFTFDANGNMTGDGTRTFEWDAENRLIAVGQGILRSEFTYDGRGRRTRILEKSNSVVVVDKRVLWSGSRPVEERTAAGSVVFRFFELGFEQSGSGFFYTRDHLSSVREIVDDNNDTRALYDYGPYGRVTKVSGDKDGPFLFAGGYFHAVSGLVLTLYRAYDPTLGRWLSEDPARFVDGLNMFSYVNNAPVNYLDPLGLQSRGAREAGRDADETMAKGICPDGWDLLFFDYVTHKYIEDDDDEEEEESFWKKLFGPGKKWKPPKRDKEHDEKEKEDFAKRCREKEGHPYKGYGWHGQQLRACCKCVE